ncbi:MAG: sulfite exporter TauE/SafE family protein [Mailhella sp.]|nr:sulfite exporter TauE/SafE family protein [Mailhella sp.]
MLLTCAVVAFGWFWGGMISGISGVGAVMVAMPLATLVVSPAESVLLSNLVGMYASIHMGVAYRRFCVWKDVRNLIVGSFPGCLLGVLLLKVAPAQTLQLMISAVLAVFVLMQTFRLSSAWKLPDSTVLGVAVGVVCGFVGGSVTMVGAPLGIYVLLKQWDPDRARGNMSVFYVFTGIGSVVAQAVAGLYDVRLIQTALAGVAACSVGAADRYPPWAAS